MVGPESAFTFIAYMDQGEPHDLDITASPGGGVTAEYSMAEVQSGAALVFHMGDVAYANGDPGVWDRWVPMGALDATVLQPVGLASPLALLSPDGWVRDRRTRCCAAGTSA